MTWASFLGSLVAVFAVAGLVKWLDLGRAEPLDEAAAQRIAEEVFIGHRFGAAAVDRDGRAALVEGLAGEVALVRAHGDKWVARLLGPATVTLQGERLVVPAGETMFGATTLALAPAEAERWAAKLKGATGA